MFGFIRLQINIIVLYNYTVTLLISLDELVKALSCNVDSVLYALLQTLCSSTVAWRNTSIECMLLFRLLHTRQDEVTYTLTQWCSCGGVSVNEFMEDCLILLYNLLLYLLFINVSM